MANDRHALSEADAGHDPFALFGRWFDAARRVVPEAEAMAVATADVDGRPSVRMVLLKSWDEQGFVFYTNFDSRKGHELAVNPRAALLFHWEPSERQIRIEGSVERLDDGQSDAYFASRPEGGRIGAHASHQSRPIESRGELDRRFRELASEFSGKEIPRPPWWGGYRVVPDAFEFWQGREHRLHDRLHFVRNHDGWRVERLQP